MKKPRPALFENYIIENGERRRATRAELAEAHRLWWRHRDIRENRADGQRDGSVPDRGDEKGAA